MSGASYKFEKANRSLLERLFEPPAVGKMSPVAKIVAYAILFFWSLFVIFPLYWVIITAFKNGQIVNEGPYYIPFVDFQPTLDGLARPNSPRIRSATCNRWAASWCCMSITRSPLSSRLS